MKKIFTLSLISLSLFLLAPVVAAADSINEIDTPRELHLQLQEDGLVKLSDSGHIEVKEDLSEVGYDQGLVEEYQNYIKEINSKISDGIVKINSDLEVAPIDPQEVSNKVYEQDKEDEPMVSTMSTYLNVVSLVEGNRQKVEDQFNMMYTVSPGSAYSYTVGWWVGKVKEKGAWDYKTVSGFSPWYKTFSMGLYNSTETHNSKWLGNYNYGYTGEYLFSESVLLTAGDIVSYATLNWRPDSQTAKNAISRGHDNAEAYD